MKIAVSGVAGTGKTTLCKLLGKHTFLNFVPDINDIVLKEMGFESGSQLFDKRGKEGILEWHKLSMEAKVEHDLQEDNYIVDKSILDFFARWYARVQNPPKDLGERVESLIESSTKIVEYDKIIYLPLNLNLSVEDNGMRTTDPQQRIKFDLILRGLSSKYNFSMQEYDFLFSDSPEKVLKDLNLYHLKKNDKSYHL